MKSISELTNITANKYQSFVSRRFADVDFIAGANWERNRDKWISVEERPIELTDMEIIAHNPNWIDEDFNPRGTRVGFMMDDGKFISSRWCDYQDCYIEDDTELPTHYMFIPEPPKQNS